MYLTVHSYSQMILYPGGYGSDIIPDADELQAMGEVAAEAMLSATSDQTNYTVGNADTLLGPAAGNRYTNDNN